MTDQPAPVPPTPAAEPTVSPRHCSNRLFEWTMAGIMIGIALSIAYDPRTIAFGGFHMLQNVGLSSAALGVAFALGGCTRGAALYANGQWPVYGPLCRALCAVMGAMIWAQMAYSLFEWSRDQGYVSIGVSVYLGLMVGEMISCARAGTDGRAR